MIRFRLRILTFFEFVESMKRRFFRPFFFVSMLSVLKSCRFFCCPVFFLPLRIRRRPHPSTANPRHSDLDARATAAADRARSTTSLACTEPAATSGSSFSARQSATATSSAWTPRCEETARTIRESTQRASSGYGWVATAATAAAALPLRGGDDTHTVAVVAVGRLSLPWKP